MTKKHFELVANVIRREMSIAELAADVERGQTIAGLARLLASEFQHTNNRFDRKRFLAACQVSE